MGMSASQARLIALTGRKNDIEYQGQQINQQRTTLASQINALYNSLLEMDVPTPPSTLDYKKTVYTGTNNATRFSVGTVTPTGDNSYTIDLQFEMSGDSLQNANKAVTLSPASEFLYYKEVNKTEYLIKQTVEGFEIPEKSDITLEELNTLATQEDAGQNDDLLVNMTVEQYNQLVDAGLLAGNVYTTDTKEGTSYLKELDKKKDIQGLGENSNILVQINASDLLANETLATICGLNIQVTPATEETPETRTLSGEPKNIFSADLKETKINYYEDGNYLMDNSIQHLGLCIINKNGEEEKITTAEDLDKCIQNGDTILTSCSQDEATKEVKNPHYNSKSSSGYQVGNMTLYNLSDEEAQKQMPKSLDSYINGIKHSFPEYAQLSDNEIMDKFCVYFEEGTNGGSTKVHFIKKSEIGCINQVNTPVYDYDATGTYTQSKPTEGCELEFDSNGRISRIGIPDNKGQITYVDVEFTTETDEDAYQDAMVQYEYKKYKYDQEQQEINAKTSIIQAQDKNLELKLTRLDNERKAVDTELEAVKKVVEDNINKSFKTFNG